MTGTTIYELNLFRNNGEQVKEIRGTKRKKTKKKGIWNELDEKPYFKCW